MENSENTNKPKKGLAIAIIAVVVVIALIVVAIIMQRNGNLLPGDNQGQQEPTGQVDQNGNEGEDPNNPENGEDGMEGDEPIDEDVTLEIVDPGPTTTTIPGGNPVNTDNKAVSPITGQIVENDAEVMGENSPRQTGVLDKDSLSEEVIKIDVGDNAYSVSEFTVSPGELVNIALTSTDDSVHTFKFRDDVLSSISVLVGPGQTRGITFNAPEEPGNYEYYCSVSKHDGRGEEGVMIVQ